jgi:hypothetical protein
MGEMVDGEQPRMGGRQKRALVAPLRVAFQTGFGLAESRSSEVVMGVAS